MPWNPERTPSYRLHKASGQAVVVLNGSPVYLGRHGTPESRAAYDRTIAEWLANGRRLSSAVVVTVSELADSYRQHCQSAYRSSQPVSIGYAIRPVRQLYGATPAAEFGPLALKAIRQRFIEQGNCRNMVNTRVRMIVRMFKWAASEQMVPSSTWEALRAVEGIRKGARGVRESPKVKPVPDAYVDATLPFLSRQVAAMVQIQRLTGARPGEVCSMRTCDLNTAGRIWEYRPDGHKGDHLDRDRVLFIGPAAQDVLREWLRPALAEYLFSPAEATAERMEALRAARKSPVQPSQVDRSKADPRKTPGDRYTTVSYRRAIQYAIDKANRARRAGSPEIPSWHPHQLRHNAGTALRRQFGLDVARAVLGHSTPDVTEIYAELDEAKARDAMERMG